MPEPVVPTYLGTLLLRERYIHNVTSVDIALDMKIFNWRRWKATLLCIDCLKDTNS